MQAENDRLSSTDIYIVVLDDDGVVRIEGPNTKAMELVVVRHA